jgi:nitroreductase/NAD-dependent dihydropyrimidine dehydrogenase PreA subunit
MMGFIKVDESKCKKDGICVRDCLPAIIRLSKDSGFPEMIPGSENICLLCGHCVAVCPEGALSHEKISFELDSPVTGKPGIDEAQAVQFLRSRRSIRQFLKKPVERGKIERLIEVARYAPTAGNSQTVEWLVHTDRSKISEIAALAEEWARQAVINDPFVAVTRPYLPKIIGTWDAGRESILRSAPVLIIASAPKQAAFGFVDLTIALSYLDLLAPTMGLGTCWAGLLQGALLSSSALKEKAGIPAEHPHHYPMVLGYPAIKYHRLPERKPPRITFAS